MEDWQEEGKPGAPTESLPSSRRLPAPPPRDGKHRTAAPHQPPQGDCLHRRGSGKKNAFPPQGQKSPELAPPDLPLCPSHLFSAVQRLEHGTEKPALVSKPPEAEISSTIQEYPKHRDKDCSQGPIGLSARHSSLDNASGGRGRRCRGGSAAGAPTLLHITSRIEGVRLRERGTDNKPGPVPLCLRDAGTAEVPTFLGKLLAMAVTGPAAGPEPSRCPGEQLPVSSFPVAAAAPLPARLSAPQSAGREERHQPGSALIKYTKQNKIKSNHNKTMTASAKALPGERVPSRNLSGPLGPGARAELASLRLPPPSRPPEAPGSLRSTGGGSSGLGIPGEG